MISCIVCNVIVKRAKDLRNVKRKEVRAMAREDLKPVRTKEEAKKRGRAGGIKSGEVRKARKTLKEELLLLLSQGDTQNRMSLALIEKAMNGDTKAFEVIRDSIGEKQVEKIQANVFNYEDSLKAVDGDEY